MAIGVDGAVGQNVRLHVIGEQRHVTENARIPCPNMVEKIVSEIKFHLARVKKNHAI